MAFYNVANWNAAIVAVTVTAGPPPVVSEVITSLQEQITSIGLPSVSLSFDDEPRAGLPGVINYAQGYEGMESEISGKGFSEELCTALNTSLGTKNDMFLRFIGIGCPTAGATKLKVQVDLRGIPMSAQAWDASAQEQTTFSFGFKVNAFRILFGDAPTNPNTEYIPKYFLYKTGATDHLSGDRTMLGIAAPPASAFFV